MRDRNVFLAIHNISCHQTPIYATLRSENSIKTVGSLEDKWKCSKKDPLNSRINPQRYCCLCRLTRSKLLRLLKILSRLQLQCEKLPLAGLLDVLNLGKNWFHSHWPRYPIRPDGRYIGLDIMQISLKGVLLCQELVLYARTTRACISPENLKSICIHRHTSWTRRVAPFQLLWHF